MASADGHQPIECRRVQVRGRVQGVGFREACVSEARRLGVTGWVRNRSDGSVEAQIQGTGDQLDRMLRWLRQGPALAIVDQLDVQPGDLTLPKSGRFERWPSV